MWPWKRTDRSEVRRMEELRLLFDLYRLGVETQMHLNDLILRTRSLGASGTVLILGGAMFLRAQDPSAAISIGGVPVAVAALTAAFAPVLLGVAWVIDRRYYLALLGGASRYIYRIEDYVAARAITVAGMGNAFAQGRTIQAAFGRQEGASTKYVKQVYRAVLVAELVLIGLLFWSGPQQAASDANPSQSASPSPASSFTPPSSP